MSHSFRTDKTQAAYETYSAAEENEDNCGLCKAKSLHEFEHWRVISNKYPYDKVADKNSVLVPKRHAKEVELTETEKKELFQLKSHDVINEYEFLVETVKRKTAIIGHYHLDLVKPIE